MATVDGEGPYEIVYEYFPVVLVKVPKSGDEEYDRCYKIEKSRLEVVG